MTLVKTNMHFRVVPRQICRCNGCIYYTVPTNIRSCDPSLADEVD